MRKVLIVDDDPEVLNSLRKELSKDSDFYQVEFVSSGKEALEKLEEEDYDLLITDIRMPGMDGVELLVEILNRGKWVHVMVASGEATMRMISLKKMEALEKFGVLNYIFKPYVPSSLRKLIKETLKKISEADYISGISLPTLLQVMELEGKSGILRVRSGKREGAFFFDRGVLVDAVSGNKTGTEAALEILSWGDVKVQIEYLLSRRERAIKESITHLILEAARRKDEG